MPDIKDAVAREARKHCPWRSYCDGVKDEKYYGELKDALREVDEIRHKLKGIVDANSALSPELKDLVSELKKPCMVIYAR